MQVYIMLAWILILSLLLVLFLWKPPVNQELIRQNLELRKQNQELLNRLQAPDVRTFQALQASLTTIQNEPYISRDDEAEAARLVEANGIGEAHYLNDEDVRSYSLQDFGMGLSDESGGRDPR